MKVNGLYITVNSILQAFLKKVSQVYEALNIFKIKQSLSEVKELTTNLKARGEFHHLLSLDVLQPIDTGNTVTDAQHAPSLFQISLQTIKPCQTLISMPYDSYE